jgi:hypothetical protein
MYIEIGKFQMSFIFLFYIIYGVHESDASKKRLTIFVEKTNLNFVCVKEILFQSILYYYISRIKKSQFKKKKEQKPDIAQDREYENNQSLKSNTFLMH